jgi:2-haloalkanoic acid dehalogenase type II
VPAAPKLLTFDVFGTVLDWRRGLVEAVRAMGISIDEARFQAVIDFQAREEAGHYRPYADILADSLVAVLRMSRKDAKSVAAGAGAWPLYDDSTDALRSLMQTAFCVAMTNSDQIHGRAVQEQLGFRLSGWICAEDVRCYKPAPEFWIAVGARRGQALDGSWWHVSAYADYDLATAARLGLTTVFVERPHAVWGPATITVPDLRTLAEIASRTGATSPE